MHINIDCIPCFLRQTVDASKTVGLDDTSTRLLLQQILGLAQNLDWSLPPPVIARDIHRTIRSILDDPDPYLSNKIADTNAALQLLPRIKAAIKESEDPFLTAVKFSIGGNAIDLGAKSYTESNIAKTFDDALGSALDRVSVRRLQAAIQRADNVLFLADNAGEIVFDRPLLEFCGNNVTVAVRGAPVINDATREDAIRSGLVDRFHVISNGSDTPGTWLEDCSSAFVREFNQAELVIAKGQGNYESLSDNARPIFFLFLAKCPVVSHHMGVPVNTPVIKQR